ncbi:hypothetical protein [Roseateles sp.]|uniref:hypothetical protein n=1 Tax=Roseateles sp. TaxID=1971397 RepID=UPI0039ECA4D5
MGQTFLGEADDCAQNSLAPFLIELRRAGYLCGKSCGSIQPSWMADASSFNRRSSDASKMTRSNQAAHRDSSATSASSSGDAASEAPRRSSLLTYKDHLLLVVSILLGVASALATTALQARYTAKQALFDRQMSALTAAATEYNRYFDEYDAQLGALDLTLRQFREDHRLGSADPARFASDWNAQVSSMKEQVRKQTPVIDMHAFVLHVLFTPDEALADSSPDGGDTTDSVTTAMNTLRRTLQDPALGNADRMKLAVSLADVAEPWVKDMRRGNQADRKAMNSHFLDYSKSLSLVR